MSTLLYAPIPLQKPHIPEREKEQSVGLREKAKQFVSRYRKEFGSAGFFITSLLLYKYGLLGGVQDPKKLVAALEKLEDVGRLKKTETKDFIKLAFAKNAWKEKLTKADKDTIYQYLHTEGSYKCVVYETDLSSLPAWFSKIQKLKALKVKSDPESSDDRYELAVVPEKLEILDLSGTKVVITQKNFSEHKLKKLILDNYTIGITVDMLPRSLEVLSLKGSTLADPSQKETILGFINSLRGLKKLIVSQGVLSDENKAKLSKSLTKPKIVEKN